MDTTYYEHQLACHCAPTFRGIKAGSMIALQVKNSKEFNMFLQDYAECFRCHGIEFIQLSKQKNHRLMLFYKPELMKRMLRRPLAVEILKQFGYPVDEKLDSLLEYLVKRVKESAGFPHEIGIFLGYPPQDVKGFIDYKGHNYLFSGLWKVYSNVPAVKRLFQCYNDCINNLCNQLSSGTSLREAIRAA
ncbi:MAG: DUF3793 family protein [Anaerovibrio sp.]|uniref:DUF3793 family protein n=1 Tax=Anaerovibrio sp. TaxID=1872532 RepID=UPI0025DF1BCB|nr:DUF3793 family protein [Anaerovibrio sp.]MCR5177102.1 DUF3793 family protein [Anaerovibrio sp.]